MKATRNSELAVLRRRLVQLRAAHKAAEEAADQAAADGAASALQAAIANLVEGGALERACTAGDHAPQVALPDQAGKQFELAAQLQRGPVVMVFYRGGWCPYCGIELQSMNVLAEDIASRGGMLVGVSPQTVMASRRTQRELGLNFPLLSDSDAAVARAFGIAWAVPDALRRQMEEGGVLLSEYNGNARWLLPMAARYVIARNGIVAYAEVCADPRRRGNPASLLQVLDALR